MITYLQRQFLLAILVLIGLSLLVFVMLSYIPGSTPEILALQSGSAVSAEDMERIRERLGLNDTLSVQYLRFASSAVRGDLGRSFRSNRPVTEIILETLPRTVELALAGMAIAVTLGVVLGVIAGINRGTWLDMASMVLALVGWSMPNFWLGIQLLIVFALHLGWFPITGQGGLQRLVLPAMTLGLGSAGQLARLSRTEILEQLGREYVVAARAKGLSVRAVVLKHVLRNSLIPVITVIGLQFGRLLGGTVIIENVFARQGVGRVAVEALLARDMPVVQGCTLFLAIVFILANMSVDLLYGLIDPRIRVGGAP